MAIVVKATWFEIEPSRVWGSGGVSNKDGIKNKLSRRVFFVQGKIPNPPKQPAYLKMNFSLALKLWELLKT